MTMDVKIRKALPEDAGQIGALLAELRHGYPEEQVRWNIDELSRNEHDALIVAVSGDTVLGLAHLHTATLIHEPAKIARVAALIVRGGYRRQGIGSALMASLERLATESGCSSMDLTSSSDRDEAHRFYKSLGYTEKSRRFVKEL